MHNKSFNWFLGFTIFVLLIRLISLASYPLIDTTEARYAEIGRLMFETGDWITPYFNHNIPFWGKPPLSFWGTALSFNIFGVNDFSARFPSWLLGVGCLVILKLAAKPLAISNHLLAPAMLLSSAVFFVSIGAVMTEASLMLGIVLSMVSALHLLANEKLLTHYQAQKYWALLFFVGLAIGMLAKGPIILVFIGVPLCFWSVVHGQIKRVWSQFYWLRGILLFLIICLPWYILAELKTPGFINYFIIGEHFNRFVVSGWKGDLYGSAHNETYGTIWLYWLYASMPWGIIAISYITQTIAVDIKSRIKRFKLDKIDWLLIYWAIFPQLFFTFAGNILWTYIAPGLPAFFLFAVRKMEQVYFSKNTAEDRKNDLAINKHMFILKYIGLITPLIFIVYIGQMNFQPLEIKSEKSLINHIALSKPEIPIYYLDKLQFSSRFYSYGKAKLLTIKELNNLSNEKAYLAIPHYLTNNFDDIKLKLKLKEIDTNYRYKLYEVGGK